MLIWRKSNQTWLINSKKQKKSSPLASGSMLYSELNHVTSYFFVKKISSAGQGSVLSCSSLEGIGNNSKDGVFLIWIFPYRFIALVHFITLVFSLHRVTGL